MNCFSCKLLTLAPSDFLKGESWPTVKSEIGSESTITQVLKQRQYFGSGNDF